jgi:hypothetical protein
MSEFHQKAGRSTRGNFQTAIGKYYLVSEETPELINQ